MFSNSRSSVQMDKLHRQTQIKAGGCEDSRHWCDAQVRPLHHSHLPTAAKPPELGPKCSTNLDALSVRGPNHGSDCKGSENCGSWMGSQYTMDTRIESSSASVSSRLMQDDAEPAQCRAENRAALDHGTRTAQSRGRDICTYDPSILSRLNDSGPTAALLAEI